MALERTGTRVALGLIVLAAVGVVGGYGVAMRATPEAVEITLDATPGATAEPAELNVHVAGAVERPGVYALSEGDRVDDAIRAAGGPTDDADLDALNLAALLRDGDKVLVPVRGGDESSGGSASGLVNMNTASAAELETLPGIGPALAQRIIDHREANGSFRTLEDLLEVPGIGERTLERLTPHITV